MPVVARDGVSLESEGEQLVNAFATAEGVADVTLDLASSTVHVGYCDSSQSEESIRQILLSTGLVEVAAAAAPSAPTSGTAGP